MPVFEKETNGRTDELELTRINARVNIQVCDQVTPHMCTLTVTSVCWSWCYKHTHRQKCVELKRGQTDELEPPKIQARDRISPPDTLNIGAWKWTSYQYIIAYVHTRILHTQIFYKVVRRHHVLLKVCSFDCRYDI